MKKFVSIFKNKEIVGRIFFTIMILFIVRIGAAITVPGVKVGTELSNAMNSGNAIALMDLLGGGALSNFSVFALGVSPYITAQIIIELLSKDVLPALTELSKQGEYGRKKSEMATRYLTLLLRSGSGVWHHQDDGEQLLHYLHQ
jgi:preprotein translocase subunit SecY